MRNYKYSFGDHFHGVHIVQLKSEEIQLLRMDQEKSRRKWN
jgi:hypothetical protein